MHPCRKDTSFPFSTITPPRPRLLIYSHWCFWGWECTWVAEWSWTRQRMIGVDLDEGINRIEQGKLPGQCGSLEAA